MNLELLEEMPSIRDSSDALQGIAEALAATKRLNRMTLDLLDIARLETSSMPIRRTPTDLREIFARVKNDNLAAARVQGSRIHIDLAGAAEVNVDIDLLVRALDNLVENALRHARNVTLSATANDGQLTIRVSDDGPGIPPEMLDKLFDKYVQVSTPGLPTRTANRGLGLTFVRLVAQGHGGDAEVECPPSGGSVFTLQFKL